ncbi:peptidoglycan DD-metalloendopeptidase family protein [Halothermothrix orenii]|uniref:Peptidase M23B n=1 Tax=Halothermothrix orenii (strain H 168 / OCM 544 / DSM 9562) TaxID=373903 RepID=B8CX33_HALOH|nr:M23 family metallopeptidase [Halothermothrix orenii]ACL69852.1 peptidase M23B [Halothermothrix orenii H 168]
MKLLKNIIVLFVFIVFLTSLVQAAETTVYTVKRGDTLSKIAHYFDVNIEKIISLNKINNPDVIRIGQKIKIPVKKVTYQVKRGDSLWEIAKKFRVNIKTLIKINQIKNPRVIYAGQKIMIPTNSGEVRYTLASRSYDSHFIWPVQGRLTSEFGWRIHPIRKEKHFHTGIDIAVPIGSPVYAAEEGIVIYSGWKNGYGNLVIIKHRDNKLTYYAHNLRLLVKKGERVKQGRIIALSGNSGDSTGPHLHFEIRVGNRVVNPLQYLNKRYLLNGFRV